MPDQQQTVEMVVIIIVIGAVVIGLISMLVGWVVERWDRFCAWWEEGFEHARQCRYVNTAALSEDEPEPLCSSPVPHMNAIEPDMSSSLNPAELVLNADEVAAVIRMIEHNKTAAKPSKSSTIQAGFGVSRGGSQLYQRASAIYDALFGPPVPAVQYRQQDGSVEPPSHPITGHIPMRTRAR